MNAYKDPQALLACMLRYPVARDAPTLWAQRVRKLSSPLPDSTAGSLHPWELSIILGFTRLIVLLWGPVVSSLGHVGYISSGRP